MRYDEQRKPSFEQGTTKKFIHNRNNQEINRLFNEEHIHAFEFRSRLFAESSLYKKRQ